MGGGTHAEEQVLLADVLLLAGLCGVRRRDRAVCVAAWSGQSRTSRIWFGAAHQKDIQSEWLMLIPAANNPTDPPTKKSADNCVHQAHQGGPSAASALVADLTSIHQFVSVCEPPNLSAKHIHPVHSVNSALTSLHMMCRCCSKYDDDFLSPIASPMTAKNAVPPATP